MTIGDTRLREIRAEFPILHRKVYLNSCSLGALSRRAEAGLSSFLDMWHQMGASAWYEHWLGRIEHLRQRVAEAWGASAGETALLPSTSAALSVVAESLPRDRRNRVVCTELDFPTLVYQWAVKPDVEVVILESPDGIGVDPQQFADAVDDRTLFLATSHVFFTTGFVQDLTALADIAHAAGAYCLIDGYQGLGQVPVDLRSSGVDFYTAGPLKWMCGGPGLAYLFARKELIPEMRPRITSWFATEAQFDFDVRSFEPRSDARRFELGTPALPTVHTALGAHEVIDGVGLDAVVSRNRKLTGVLVEGLRAAGFSPGLPPPDARSAIVTVPHPDPAAAVAHLAAEGVIVDHRPGLVRISPHFYNTEDEVLGCVELLAMIRT